MQHRALHPRTQPNQYLQSHDARMNSVHSYPPTQPDRIVSSTVQAHTEPLPRVHGFMRSTMRYHDVDDVDEGIMVLSEPERQSTQQEQDALDENARKRAMRNLVNSWQERLQLISVITTFFASTEAVILVAIKPDTTDSWGTVLKTASASLLGALIVHVDASILSFLGAFLLTTYKLKAATREEMIAEGIKIGKSPHGGSFAIQDIERDPVNNELQQTSLNNDADAQSTIHKSTDYSTVVSARATASKGTGLYPVEPSIISTDPYLEQVRPLTSHLLSRTHALCVFLAAVGFVLAIIGIMCYAWASQPREVSIFASTCLGGVVLAMAVLLI